MNDIKINTTYTLTKKVTKEMLACFVTSGDVEVFATPQLVVMYENAANNCLKQFLDSESISVGTSISCTHSKATALGKEVTVTVTITQVEGKQVTFDCKACDNDGEISIGKHERFIVNKEKFMKKVTASVN